MNSVDLSIIIVNWKSSEYTHQCLKSIYANSSSLRIETIVVDNASFDGCGEMIAKEFPQATFIQSEINLGFAGANNLAFKRSQGRAILFLNPDTEVQGEALQTLMSNLDSIGDAGMVGARLLNSDFSLQTTCVVALPSILNTTLNSEFLRRKFPRWTIWGMRPLFADGNTPVPVEAISGACMLGRREAIAAVDGFTSDYFMYSEDMDLCLKIRKAGWKIYYVPEAKIVHHAARSSAERDENDFSTLMTRESLMRFMELHRGRGHASVYRLTTAVVAIGRIVLLSLAVPFRPQRRQGSLRALKKWTRVVAWCFGLTPWVAQQRPEPALSAGRAAAMSNHSH